MRRACFIATASGGGKTTTNSVVLYALRNYCKTRRTLEAELARSPVVRLRTEAEVAAFLSDL